MAEIQTREIAFDLPESLATKLKKTEVVFDVPKNLPEEQQVEIANRAYDDFILEQSTVKSQYPSAKKEAPPTTMQAIGAGLKKAGSDIWAGLKQTGYGMQKIPGEIGSEGYTSAQAKLDALAQEQAVKGMEYEKIRKQAPIAAGTGEVLPYMATKSPLLVGLTEATKYGEPGERAVRGTTGALMTGVGNWIGQRVSPYFNPAIDEQSLKAIKGVEPLGVQPRLSEYMGSRGVSKLEDVVAQAPFGENMLKPQTKNQLIFNRTASKSIGEDSPILTDEVLSNAAARIGQTYKNIEQTQVPIQFTKSIEQAADSILSRQAAAKRMKLKEAENPQLTATANAWKQKALKGETFSGADYNLTRENLSNLAWAAEGSEKRAYRDLLNALDDAAEQSLKDAGQTDLSNQLRTARQQYANLKTLEKGNVVSNGNVDLPKLRNAIKQGKESAYKRGQLTGDLPKLAKYSEATAPLKEGSQTAGRGLYGDLLQQPFMGTALSIPNALFAGALTSPITSFVPKKLAGTTTGKVIGEGIERGAKIPTLEAGQDYFLRRLFQPPQGLLNEEQ